MNNRAVLITGISGFLGSQIARQLLLDGYKVFATRRKKTDLARCQDFKSDISWIDLEDGDWQNKIIKLKPDIIIHSAWLGVAANDRDNWSVQFSNVEFVGIILYLNYVFSLNLSNGAFSMFITRSSL